MLRVLGHIVYWLAVLAVSAVLVFALITFFEVRDDSSVGVPAPTPERSLR